MGIMSHHILLPRYKKRSEPVAIDRTVLNDLKAVLGEEGSNTLTDLIDLFLADVPSRLAEIRRLATNADAKEIHRNVDALRGWCETLGASEMICVCREMELFLENLEVDCDACFDRDKFSVLFHEIEDAYARAASELLIHGAEI
jgi:HPt (histidine-containing phosphotransfer) domain-containing protein